MRKEAKAFLIKKLTPCDLFEHSFQFRIEYIPSPFHSTTSICDVAKIYKHNVLFISYHITIPYVGNIKAV